METFDFLNAIKIWCPPLKSSCDSIFWSETLRVKLQAFSECVCNRVQGNLKLFCRPSLFTIFQNAYESTKRDWECLQKRTSKLKAYTEYSMKLPWTFRWTRSMASLYTNFWYVTIVHSISWKTVSEYAFTSFNAKLQNWKWYQNVRCTCDNYIVV